MQELDLKQDDRISFDNGTVKGEGIVMGIATTGIATTGIATTGDALLGKSYIIKPDVRIANDVYDFECICMHELYMKKL